MMEMSHKIDVGFSQKTPVRFLTGPEVGEPTRITSRESYE